MEDKLIYKINKKEYLLVNVPYTRYSRYETFGKKLELMGCIEQGIKNIHGRGFFSSTVLVMNWLIPVNKIKEYQELQNSVET